MLALDALYIMGNPSKKEIMTSIVDMELDQ